MLQVSRVWIRCHIPGKLTCTSHSSDGVRLGVSRRLAGSKMFLMDVDVDVDTTDNVPVMVD